jgi:hypothetical protein
MLLDLKEPYQNDESDTLPPEGPRTAPLWAAFGVLVIVLVGAIVYGYRALQKDNIQLVQVADALKSSAALSTRLGVAENKMQSWVSQLSEIAGRVGQLEHKTDAGLALERQHADKLNAATEKRIHEQLAERTASIDRRLIALESGQAVEKDRLSQLQQQVQQQASGVPQVVAASQDNTRESAGDVQQQPKAAAPDPAVPDHRIERQRVKFEVAKKRTYELTKGISVHLNATNVRYQLFGGWVSLTPDGRTLWMDSRGVQQPVVFYRKDDDQPCELVVTQVAKDSVVGYLLLPVEQDGSASGPVAQLAPVARSAK